MSRIPLPPARTLLAATLLGLATGGRSTAGLTAVAFARGGRWPRRAASLAAGGELVVDKLPKTPSRLQPAGLGARVVLGGLSAWALTRQSGAVGIGAGAALAGSFAGARWRALAAAKGRPDLPAALAEDLVVAGLAAGAVALARRPTRIP